MKINRNSWHYRLIDWVSMDAYRRSNLCSYMRGLVISLSIAVGIAMLSGVLTVISIIGYIIGPLKAYPYLAVFLGLLGSITPIILGLCRLSDAVSSYNYRHRKPKVYKPREPSVVVEYLKARKHKICPLIEFTSDE